MIKKTAFTFPHFTKVAGAELLDERDLRARYLVLVPRGVFQGVVLGVGARLDPGRRARQLTAEPLALGRGVAGHEVLQYSIALVHRFI